MERHEVNAPHDNTAVVISIVIVNWNTRDMLMKCLSTIYDDKTDGPIEIIVVDNASTDRSVEAVRKAYPQVKIIQNDRNLGFAKANNIGIRESRGDYICLVNSDIEILHNCFGTLAEFMENNSHVGIVGPKTLWPDMTLQPSCREFPTLWNTFCFGVGLYKLFRDKSWFSGEHMLYFPHDTTRRVEVLTGSFMMIRRKALKEVGLMDEGFFMYGEETDLCRRFAGKGWDVFFFPEVRVIHYGGGSSTNEPLKLYKELYKSKLKYWRKHSRRLPRLGFRVFTMFRQVARIASGAVKSVLKPSLREEMKVQMDGAFSVILLMLSPEKQKKRRI